MVNLWNDRVTWEGLEQRFRNQGVNLIQVKFLTPNHNSKNQIAGLGSDMTTLSHLFPGPVSSHRPSSGKPKAGAPI